MHHGDWGRDGGFHWLGLVWLIVTLLAAGGLVWFGATLLRRTHHLEATQAPAVLPAPSAAARPTARDILDERLARGEIDVDDYHQRIAALAGTGTTGGAATGDNAVER
jgi:putative membrane protein